MQLAMATDMKMRARLQGNVAEIKILMSHPMETGRRKNDLDEIVPAHFIQLVHITLNDKPVLEAQWGTGISKNPYLTFHVKGAKVGDKVRVTWYDNLGMSSTHEDEVVQG